MLLVVSNALREVTFATIGALWWGQRTTRLQDIPSMPPSAVTYSPDVTCGTEPKRTCPAKQTSSCLLCITFPSRTARILQSYGKLHTLGHHYPTAISIPANLTCANLQRDTTCMHLPLPTSALRSCVKLQFLSIQWSIFLNT